MVESVVQDHTAFPLITQLIVNSVIVNGGLYKGRSLGDIHAKLDESLGAEGVYHTDLMLLENWLGSLSTNDLETITAGEEREVAAIFETAPDMGDVVGGAQAFVNNVYEYCV